MPFVRTLLASTSPARLSVLRSAGVEPECLSPEVDEDALLADLRRTPGGDAEHAEDIVTTLARAKAEAVLATLDSPAEVDTVLIAGDSMLLIDGELQGKPHTVEATIARWQAQRGREAELITGHAIAHLPAGSTEASHIIVEASRTRLRFAEASDADITAYARTGEPLGCAGAFTLEALGGWFIDRIEGDPSSVIGLSLPVVRRALEQLGLAVSDLWNRVEPTR